VRFDADYSSIIVDMLFQNAAEFWRSRIDLCAEPRCADVVTAPPSSADLCLTATHPGFHLLNSKLARVSLFMDLFEINRLDKGETTHLFYEGEGFDTAQDYEIAGKQKSQ
jgi:hypothetical protein